MSFTFSEQHLTSFYHHGYTVFRGILPSSLVRDLRRVTDQTRQMAWEEHGPQAQRLQPMERYGDRLDLQPFRDYLDLPELVDAIHQTLSPDHTMGGLHWLGVLNEPKERPHCTSWHRDITVQSPGLDPEEFRRLDVQPTFFCQINCALYTDTDLWYVAGSAGRPNTPSEAQAAENKPNTEGLSNEEAERVNYGYCQGMPGASQLLLEAGDFALYRPTGWHIGNYVPYRKRATLHDGVWTPVARQWVTDWFDRMRKLQEEKQKTE